MAALMPQGKQQYFTAGGIPLVGGKVYTYAAGTTTPLATYTTAAASTPNTNPVILDSRGEASIFFSAANYKIVVKDSLDSTIWTQDNLVGDVLGSLAVSTGSSLVGHVASGTGAVATTVQTKLRENVSLADFGADTTGATDCSAAFALAIAAIGTNGEIKLNGLDYKLTAPVTIPKGITISGGGAYINCVGLTACLYVSGTGIENLTIRDCNFYGDGTTGNTPSGGAIQSPSGCETTGWSILNCSFDNLSFGVAINSNLSGFHKRPKVIGCRFTRMVGTTTGVGIGLNIAGGFNTVMAAEVIGNSFDTIGRHSCYVSSGIGVLIEGNTFRSQSSATAAISACAVARASSVLVTGNSFIFNNCAVSVEPAESSVVAQGFPDSYNISVLNNIFVDNTSYDVYVGTSDTAAGTRGLYNVTVSGNTIEKAGAYNISNILVLGCNRLTIKNNVISNIRLTGNHTLAAIYLEALAVSGQSTSDYVISDNVIRENLAGGAITDTRGITITALAAALRVSMLRNDIVAITLVNGWYGLGELCHASQGITGAVGKYVAGTTTPNVYGLSYLRIANTGATTITQLANGVDGQVLTLQFADVNTTITRNNSYLVGGANYTSGINTTLTLVSYNGNWYELARSAPT